jgi:hypothetical protein
MKQGRRGCRRNKASRGCENLKAQHSRVRQARCRSLPASASVEEPQTPREDRLSSAPRCGARGRSTSPIARTMILATAGGGRFPPFATPVSGSGPARELVPAAPATGARRGRASLVDLDTRLTEAPSQRALRPARRNCVTPDEIAQRGGTASANSAFVDRSLLRGASVGPGSSSVRLDVSARRANAASGRWRQRRTRTCGRLRPRP